MTKQRLQRIISEAGICSRRKAEVLITEKRLKVNGKIASLGEIADLDVDIILLDNKQILRKIEKKVILINKPIGYISSCSDPHGRLTLLDLLPSSIKQGLYPVGRLDLNSRGAILATNHGELSLKLTHPKYAHKKTYQVLVKGSPSLEALSIWKNGIDLDGIKTMKASISVLKSDSNETLLEIIMSEGKKRQIRRIANIIGNPVLDLKRTAIGSIKIGQLKEGNWRILQEKEWKHFLR